MVKKRRHKAARAEGHAASTTTEKTAVPVETRPERPRTPPPASASRFPRVDWILVTALFVIGTILGTYHISHTATPPSFYQEYFAPAVALGCGMGYVNLGDRSPAVGDFLSVKTDWVQCAEVVTAKPTKPLPWQLMHRYQMTAAGLLWRLRGEVSWSGLAPLFGILFGATAAISYAIARLLLRRAFAIAAGLLLLFSPLHLSILPLLRDYSKAPFFLAVILLIGIFVTREMTPRRRMIMAALAGFVTGVGFGFRTDVLVCAPPMLVAMIALVPGSIRATWKHRLISAAIFCAVFFVVALPPLQGMSAQGANAHVTLLGLGSPFDDALGVSTPDYQWAYQYNDTHINALVSSFSNWRDGATTPLETNTLPYEKTGNDYLRLVARHFPADMLTRAYAAVMRVLELPANGVSNKLYIDPNQHSLGIADPMTLGRFLSFQRLVQLVTSGGAAFFLFAVATLLIVAARSVRLAITVALIVLYFGAYTMLQFSVRHAFHLELFGWIAAAFVVQSLVAAGIAWRRRDTAFAASLDWRASLAFALVIAIVPVVVLAGLRRWQDAHVLSLMETYIAADKEAVPFTIVDGSSTDRVLLQLAGDPPPAGTMRVDYLVVEVRNDRTVSPLIFRNKPILFPAWSQVRTDMKDQPPSFADSYPNDVTRYFFPAYMGPESLFEGIEVARDAAPSVAGIYRLKRSPALPLLLWMQLDADWRTHPLHQRLLGAEQRDTIRLYDDAPRVGGGFSEELTPAEILELGDAVMPAGSRGLRVHGFIDATKPMLVQYPPREVKRGATFVLEGTIHYGCVMPILNGAGLFLARGATQPGPFRIELPAPLDGKYAPLVANTECYGPNDISIAHAGWIDP